MSLDQHQKEFIKLLKANCGQYRPHQVFSDFCAMAAIGLNLPVDHGPYFEEREKRFFSIRERYSDNEFIRFDTMSKCIVESLTADFKDSLGGIFMELELGNHWRGQFFTPYDVALMMAKIGYPDHKEILDIHGFVTMNDPCSGAGALVIAMAQHLLESGINYQQHLHVIAQDIDETAAHMTYIQLSLLYIPATVVHGNSLNPGKAYPYWQTFAHIHGEWDKRMYRAKADDTMLALLRATSSAASPPVKDIAPAEQTFEMLRKRRNQSLRKYQDDRQPGLF